MLFCPNCNCNLRVSAIHTVDRVPLEDCPTCKGTGERESCAAPTGFEGCWCVRMNDAMRAEVLEEHERAKNDRRSTSRPGVARRTLNNIRRVLRGVPKDDPLIGRVRAADELQTELDAWAADLDKTNVDLRSFLDDNEMVECAWCEGEGCDGCSGNGLLRRSDSPAEYERNDD